MKYIIKCVSLAIILLLVQITIASCNNENTETPSKTDENPDFVNCPPCQDTNFRFIMTPRTLNFPNVTERSGVEFGKFRDADRGVLTYQAAKIEL